VQLILSLCYQGALSQLVLTSDANDAENQCSSSTWGEMTDQSADASPRQSSSGGGTAENYLGKTPILTCVL